MKIGLNSVFLIDTFLTWETLSAEETYKSIRNSKPDMDDIAKNKEYKSKTIQTIKNHRLYKIHRLDR